MAYLYQSYPRWMTHIDGDRKIVNSEAEEQALGSGWFRSKEEAAAAKQAKAEPPPIPKSDAPPPTLKIEPRADKNALLSAAAKV